MPVLLGALSSLLIGFADFFSRFAAQRTKAVTVVVAGSGAGLIVTAVLAPLMDGSPLARDLAFGAVSGVVSGLALALLYQGMTVASVAVVSPTASVFIAVIPFIWGLSRGESPGVWSMVGVAVVIPSLVLTSFSPELGDRARLGLALGVASGLCFGVGFVFLGETSSDSGVWPAVSQRGASMVAMLALATIQRVPRLAPPSARVFALLGGVIGSLAIVSFTLGAQQGSLSEVSVAASTYPAVTALLVWRYDRDPLRWWQVVGIVGSIAGVALIVVG